MKMPCMKIPIKLAINLIQQIRSHYKQVENPNGTISVHDLLQPNTLSEDFRLSYLQQIFEIFEVVAANCLTLGKDRHWSRRVLEI